LGVGTRIQVVWPEEPKGALSGVAYFEPIA